MLTVYRRFEADSVENTRVDSMDVRDFADEVESGLNGFKPDYVEGYNETHHRGDDLLRYIDWTTAYSEEMHARGYKVMGFSFATGNPGLPFPGDPDPDDVRHLCERGWGAVDAAAWHCYWGNQGFTQFHALRFMAAHDFAVKNHLDLPPDGFGIMECGRDAVEGGGSGWKVSGLSGDVYALECRSYGSVLAHCPYVLGGTVFTATPTIDWANFSTEGLNLTGAAALGPHCILPASSSTLDWAMEAPILKQVDRTDALRAVKGDKHPVDPAVQQVLAQNAFIAQAQYDLAKILDGLANGHPVDAQLLQDAKTNINALNPEKYKF